MSARWERVRLEEVLTERRETPDPERLTFGEIRIVSKIGFERGNIELRQEVGTKTGMILVRPGDLLLSGINAAKGSIALYGEDNTDPIAATIHYGAYYINKRLGYHKYLWWYLRSNSFRETLFESLPEGIKTELKSTRFLPIKIPLPPMEEQRRIVARIEALAAEIGHARTLRQQAAEEAEALTASEAFSIFGADNADRWPSRTLGELAEIRSGVTLGRRLVGATIRLPYLRVANVQDGHLDLSVMKEVEILAHELNKWQLQAGDLLLTEGGDWDKLGRGTIWNNEIPNCIHQNHIFRLRTNKDECDPYFLSALIASPFGKDYFQKASKQTTNLASVNQRQLRSFCFFLPPLPEQHRIVAELDELQAEVDRLKALQAETAAEIDALLPAILDRAFKGELTGAD